MHQDRFREAIGEAYADAIKDVWGVYFEALQVADQETERAKAYERFMAAIAIAQEAHETALEAVV